MVQGWGGSWCCAKGSRVLRINHTQLQLGRGAIHVESPELDPKPQPDPLSPYPAPNAVYHHVWGIFCVRGGGGG